MAIFISHSSRDHAAVRLLAQNLQTANEPVWLDQTLIGGEAWWQRILHQIRSCTLFVVALSNSCLQSKPCRAEIEYAKSLGLPILPVLIGDVDSYRIDPIFAVQSVDFRNPDVAAGAALVAAVRERAAERKDLPDPLPAPPPIPYEYLQRLGVAIDSPDELSPTEQATILADLRHALRQEDDESVRGDIRRLLGALRRRSEVTHGTVEEIDDLLARYSATRADAAAPPERQPEAVHTEPSTPQADAPALLVGKPAPPNGTTESTKPRLSRQNPKTIAIAAGAGVLIAIIAVVAYLLVGQTAGSTANKPATSTSPPPPPVPVAALEGLLLSFEQIDSAMGTTGMGITGTSTDLADNTASVADVNCRAVDSVQSVTNFGGSGWTALRGQQLQHPPQGDTFDFRAYQGVASFPSANVAAALFTADSQHWSGCANGRYTVTDPKAGATWTTGPLSNANDTLSITLTQEGGNGWNCQKALTVTNNIAISATACSYKPTDGAVNIAHQIAAKVAKQ